MTDRPSALEHVNKWARDWGNSMGQWARARGQRINTWASVKNERAVNFTFDQMKKLAKRIPGEWDDAVIAQISNCPRLKKATGNGVMLATLLGGLYFGSKLIPAFGKLSGLGSRIGTKFHGFTGAFSGLGQKLRNLNIFEKIKDAFQGIRK